MTLASAQGRVVAARGPRPRLGSGVPSLALPQDRVLDGVNSASQLASMMLVDAPTVVQTGALRRIDRTRVVASVPRAVEDAHLVVDEVDGVEVG